MAVSFSSHRPGGPARAGSRRHAASYAALQGYGVRANGLRESDMVLLRQVLVKSSRNAIVTSHLLKILETSHPGDRRPLLRLAGPDSRPATLQTGFLGTGK